MNVAEFIEWLKTQNQDALIYVLLAGRGETQPNKWAKFNLEDYNFWACEEFIELGTESYD
jgi:hypothetical protein